VYNLRNMTAYGVHKGSGVEAEGLVKAFGSTRVLLGVDVSIERGEVLALLGPNGAGKTTTVSILATLTRPDSGWARVAGFDVLAQRSQVRRVISLTGQEVAVDGLQTGAENLRTVGRIAGLDRREARDRARVLLERFDLLDAADRRVSAFSGGMRRRLDLAAGLVVRPQVLFLDEPTTGLDPRSRQAMWDVVAELVDDGVTVLLTTQYLEEADRLADHVAVIDAGRIVAHGTPSALKRQVAGQRLELVFGDEDRYADARRALAGRAAVADDAARGLTVPTDGSAVEVRAILDHVDPDRRGVERFAVHAATLDDVFLALTGRVTTPTKEHTADV
jgi:ABC-2 type transport system ATP-binding protein